MADQVPPHLDAAAIRSLVEEVVHRLTARDATAAHTAPALAPAGGAVQVSDAVVTLAHVERLPAGTREVAIPARAVLTPSARDRAREAGITFVRAAATRAGAGSPPDAVPFMIAQADLGAAAAGRAAAVARAVPRSQRLPATGLTDVVAALALHASRDAARGVLLTSRPALAIVAANRSPNLRAVTGRDAATLAVAAADCAANLLVVDPTAFVGGLERVCADFAGRAGGVVPAELAQAPAGCACKSHPH